MQPRLRTKHVTRRKADIWIADPALKTVLPFAHNHARTPTNARVSHSTPLSGAATSARNVTTSLLPTGQPQSDSNHEHRFWFRTTVTSTFFHHRRDFCCWRYPVLFHTCKLVYLQYLLIWFLLLTFDQFFVHTSTLVYLSNLFDCFDFFFCRLFDTNIIHVHPVISFFVNFMWI